jgi:ubiquinone/menaquinone biosynthesis C-methylase UbiE
MGDILNCIHFFYSNLRTSKMTHESQPVCDLCGSVKNGRVYQLDGYDILRCRKCGLIYRHPMPTDLQLFDMYNILLTVAEEQLVAYYCNFRRETYRRMFRTLNQVHIPKNEQSLAVLDAGTGRGWSYSVVREFGHRPMGLDLGFQDCVSAQAEGPTLQASNESLPFSPACVDVVIMSDVLEHVREPRRILKEAYRVLKPEGFLILRVPDVSGVLIRAFDLAYKLTAGKFKKPGQMLYRRHLYGFSEPTLERYLSETGFQIAHQYRESSKNPSELGQKNWAQNPLIRWGIILLVRLGELSNRQDEIIVIAQRQRN